jgi:cbb3-type cytochrome oxidase subunit 3
MKLSDIMSAAGLSFYAEVALLIFLGVFIGIAFDVLRSSRRHEAARLLPLADETLAGQRKDAAGKP